LLGLFIDADDKTGHVPPKHPLIYNEQSCIISQKIEFFLPIAMRTSNTTLRIRLFIFVLFIYLFITF
jgi:hypothetical protein